MLRLLLPRPALLVAQITTGNVIRCSASHLWAPAALPDLSKQSTTPLTPVPSPADRLAHPSHPRALHLTAAVKSSQHETVQQQAAAAACARPPPSSSGALTAASMEPQQEPQPLLMPPEQQRRLLESVQDRQPVIFYHYPCPDGVFAALAATLFFSARGVTPRYVPHEVYRDVQLESLQLQRDQVAFLLDYSGPDGFPQQLAQHVGQVVVLDHHKTAAEQLSKDPTNHPANLAVCIDMQRSGAAIARDFFLLQGGGGESGGGSASALSDTLQQVYRWVEDADLWRWALAPQSREFHAGLAAAKLEYSAVSNPQIWSQLQQLDVESVMAKGTQVLRYQEQLVSEAVASSKPYQLGGAEGLTRGWGCCMGCEVSGDLVLYRSRLGNSLAQHSRAQGLSPVGLVAYTEADQPNKASHIKVSLRSVDGYDTSAVSGALGGGGHAAASSCIVTREELQRWRDMAG